MVVACIPPREHLFRVDSMYSAGVGKRGGGGRGSMGGPYNNQINNNNSLYSHDKCSNFNVLLMFNEGAPMIKTANILPAIL